MLFKSHHTNCNYCNKSHVVLETDNKDCEIDFYPSMGDIQFNYQNIEVSLHIKRCPYCGREL